MFTHIRVGSNDLARSKTFYDSALSPLGIGGQEMGGMLVYSTGQGPMYAVGTPLAGAAQAGNGGTIGFNAPSTEAVDQFHAAGLANGGTCEGAPGMREMAGMYGAYLRDPDGNKICAFKWG